MTDGAAAVAAQLLAEQARRLREWARLPPVRTFPFSHAILMALAGAVGLFAGLAAGLFSNVIALVQGIFFRPGALLRIVTGENPEWTAHFKERLREAPWHPEYLGLAIVGIAVSRGLARLAERHAPRLPRFGQPKQIRALGWLLGFGLVLYYPLLALTTFNRAFGAAHGGLYAMLHRVPGWWLVLVPALGGLMAGLLVRYVTPDSGGHGVAEVIEALNIGGKRIRTRVAVWKSVTAGLVVGSGGSAGREGPVVQIGGAIASGLGLRFGIPPEDVQLLIACGGAAGIAASFNTPIGGTLFALEILLGEFRVRSIAPVAFAAVSATITGRTLIGAGGEVVRIPFELASGAEMAAYLLLGALAAIVAVLYVRSVHGVEHAFARGRLAKIPPELRPMLGGLAVGLLGLFVPRVLGNGYETMNDALLGHLPALALVVILGAKVVASGLTLGSGAPGGSFFPAVFLGAMLGGAFGAAGHAALPSFVANGGAYAAVGMAAVVSGATQAPLTGIMILFELTGSYEIILPLMLACTTSVAGTHWILGGSIYSLKLRARGVRLKAERRRDVLHETPVAAVMATRFSALPATLPLADILRSLREQPFGAHPVVDASGKLAGLLTIEELRPVLGLEEASTLHAGDICRHRAPVAYPTQTLAEALARMSANRVSHLPVVHPEAPDVVVGLLSEHDVLRFVSAADAPEPEVESKAS